VTDIKEDKAEDICEGLVKELKLSLPKTKVMVGAEGFLFFAWV
jgi:hypothetical protein